MARLGGAPFARLLTKPWLLPGFLIHSAMLRQATPDRTALEMVTLDSLVPKDHLPRKFDAVIEFWSFMAVSRGFAVRTTVARRSMRP